MISATISPHAAADAVEPVDVAVHRVAEVVVDVDDVVAVEPGDFGTGQVAALHHDHAHPRARRPRSATSMRLVPGNGRRAPVRGRDDAGDRLPRRSSASASASGEPIASPSGRAWDVRMKDWRSRIAAATVGRGVRQGLRPGVTSRLLAARSRSRARAGSARRDPGARRSRRIRTAAPARAADGPGCRSARRRNGVARSSACAVSLRDFSSPITV